MTTSIVLRAASACALALLLPLLVHASVDDGVALYEKGDYDAAKRQLEAAVDADAKDARALYYLGRVLMAQEKPEDAEEYFARAVELEPASSEKTLWLGRAFGQQALAAGMLSKFGLARKTRAHFEKAVELDPDNHEARFDLLQYYLQAPGIVGGGKDKAEAQAVEIAKRDRWLGRHARGVIHLHEDEIDEALAAYSEEIADGGNARAYYTVAILELRRGGTARAFEVLDKLVADQPELPMAHYQLGRAGAVSGKQLAKAKAGLDAYLEMERGPGDPSLAWAQVRYGNILEHEKDFAGAKARYEKALALEPEHEEAKRALEALKKRK